MAGAPEGKVGRGDVHQWSARWVEGDDPDVPDLMVWSALQRPDGFDLVWTNAERTTVRHGGPGAHVHTSQDIRQAFSTWRAACVSYDADPAGYIRRMKEAARSAGTQ